MKGGPEHEPEELRRALAGVEGLLLDLDGVLISRGEAIPGAAAALDRLRERSVPFVVLTNTSLVSRVTLAVQARAAGFDLPPDRIVSALSATAARTARDLPGEPLFVLASEDARREFAGQRLIDATAADAPDARAAAVVVGDSPEALEWANVNRAFRLVRGGAALVAMHRNPWWLTPAGETIDSGAYVAGLEYATGARATLVGKPAPAIFREALGILRSLPGARGLRLGEVAMVGDDLRSDIAPARRLGLASVLVLTGRTSGDAATSLADLPSRARPDAIAPSLSEVVMALDPSAAALD